MEKPERLLTREEKQLDEMLDKLESSFCVAAEGKKSSSFVKSRCAELEMLKPFTEARDLMMGALADKSDRGRSRLASLVGDDAETPRIARARIASEQVMNSDMKLPVSVLRDFIEACHSCERVLQDSVSGEKNREGKWLSQMKTAAKTYLSRLMAKQKRQEALEDAERKAAMLRAMGLEPEAQSGASCSTGSPEDDELERLELAEPHSWEVRDDDEMSEIMDFDFDDDSEDGDRDAKRLQLLEEFLGEHIPHFEEAFGKKEAPRLRKRDRIRAALRLVRKEVTMMACLGSGNVEVD